MIESDQINEITAALAKAQGEFPELDRNRAADVTKQGKYLYTFKYATLDHILTKCRPVLARHDIAIVQTIGRGEVSLSLETRLLHASGQWIGSAVPLSCSADPQAFGSELTYKRRYTLAALIGVAAEEDDDGNATKGQEAQPTATTPPAGKQGPAAKQQPPAKQGPPTQQSPSHQTAAQQSPPQQTAAQQPPTRPAAGEGAAGDPAKRAAAPSLEALRNRFVEYQSADEVLDALAKFPAYPPIAENPRTWRPIANALLDRLAHGEIAEAWTHEEVEAADEAVRDIWTEVGTTAAAGMVRGEALLAWCVELREHAAPRHPQRWRQIIAAVLKRAVEAVTSGEWSAEVSDAIGEEMREQKRLAAELPEPAENSPTPETPTAETPTPENEGTSDDQSE